MKRRYWKLFALMLTLAMTVCLAAGCGSDHVEDAETSAGSSAPYMDAVTLGDVEIGDELVALSAEATAVSTFTPEASGSLTGKNDKAVIDYSNTRDGYVMVQYFASTTQKLKSQVKGPSGTTYTYNLKPGVWVTLPLSDGNGDYKVTIYENTTGTKYYTVLSQSFSVTLKDEFAPFLRPNQYVDYSNAPKTVAKAAELCKAKSQVLDKVQVVYDFVVNSFTYDKKKAATVQSGYLPVLDTVLAQKKGICFDYAALMAAMLRSQKVPCKLVVGYAGTAYHAWISVYSEADGWIDAAIYFNGSTWERMDPTFASTGKQNAAVLKYIGDGSHYTAKYLY